MTQMNTDCFASVALVSVLIGVIGGSSMHSVYSQMQWLSVASPLNDELMPFES